MATTFLQLRLKLAHTHNFRTRRTMGKATGTACFSKRAWCGREVKSSKQTGCTIYKEGFEYRSSVSGCTICVSDLTSATTTDAVEADLASTFENRNRCLSERRLDGVDPKKSIVPSGTILLEGCQRRTASGMIPKSYKDTRDLFRNQVDEQTTARLGDTQQRKTAISTMMMMMVDNLELEILEVRFEHTYILFIMYTPLDLSRKFSLSSFTYSPNYLLYCTLRTSRSLAPCCRLASPN